MSGGVNTKALQELLYAKYWDERYVLEKNASISGGTRALADDVEEDGTKGPPGETKDGELGSYEWFRTFEQIEGFLKGAMPPPYNTKGEIDGEGCKILHLGCGNSTLPSDLYNLSYHNQLCVDFSQVVISAMASKYSHLPGIAWELMDIRAMEIPTASIDVAIDKSTLDAMLHGSMWDPPEDVKENVGRYVDEVARVLKRGVGKWIYITYRQPHFMRPLLTRQGVWKAECAVLEEQGEGMFEYFGWVMTRLGEEGVVQEA